MNYFLLFVWVVFLPFQLLFGQKSKVPFTLHQMLYYENENCHSEEHQNKYTVIYQNFYDASMHVFYHMNSFNDEQVLLYFFNKNKLMHYQQFPTRKFNAASFVELPITELKNMDDIDHLPESKIKLNYIEKESIIRNNRMLTAYHFKVKNFDNVKKMIYYVDHASNGIPFSFHHSFYEEMRSEGFPIVGNVVQRDQIDSNGNTCTFVLKSVQDANKKFEFVFDQ